MEALKEKQNTFLLELPYGMQRVTFSKRGCTIQP